MTRRARQWISLLAWGLTTLAILAPIATVLARFDRNAELATHFQEPALLVSVAACLAVILRRVRCADYPSVTTVVAVALGVLVAVQTWHVFRYNGPNPVMGEPGSARLRLLVANVLTSNRDRESLIRLVREERPDVLGLIEISDNWLAGLAPIRSEYPYRYDHPAGGRGLALWFRKPPISVEGPVILTPGGNPALRASVDFAGRTRTIWLVHNVAPFDHRPGLAIDAEFAALAARIRVENGSTIVAGDANSTDGSPQFARFLAASGLRDTRLGFGRQRSWPSWSIYRIAIDHAFVSDDLAVLDRRVGPAIGSDHFPVLLDLAPAMASPSTKEAAKADHSSVESGCSSANFDRSAILKNATSSAARSGPTRSANPGSAAISSVVLEAQLGP